MAKITWLILIFFAIFIFLELSEARRGGGGRFGGRSRFARARYVRTSRVTRYVRNSRSVRVSSGFRSKFGGFRLGSKSAVRNAILLGTIYGALKYRRKRPRFRSGSDDDLPQVCYNDRYTTNAYGNVSYYGRFICPDDFQENNNYCCGDEGNQYCCSFWDDGGRVAGVVIGIIIFVVIIGVVVYCCCCRKRRNQHKPPTTGTTHSYGNKWGQSKQQNGYPEQSVPLNEKPGGYYQPTAPQPYPQPDPYPPQGYNAPPQGYSAPPQGYNAPPPPPSYDAAAGDGQLPYEVSPVPQQTPPYPGTAPYPSAPYPPSNPPYPNQ